MNSKESTKMLHNPHRTVRHNNDTRPQKAMVYLIFYLKQILDGVHTEISSERVTRLGRWFASSIHPISLSPGNVRAALNRVASMDTTSKEALDEINTVINLWEWSHTIPVELILARSHLEDKIRSPTEPSRVERIPC